MSVIFRVVLSHPNVKFSKLLIKCFSCFSCVPSCVSLSHRVSISAFCSLFLGMSPSQSSRDQSDGTGKGVEHHIYNKYDLQEILYKASLGGVYHFIFVHVIRFNVAGIVSACFYRIKPMFMVRLPDSGLTWSTFSGITFWLRRGGKLGHCIVIVPCCCLSTLILEGLNLHL